MATYTGFLFPESFGAFNLDKNEDFEALPAVNVRSFADSALTLYGDRTHTQPVSEYPRTLTGFVMQSFGDDYYNTIWIIPNPIDLGYVVDGQQVSVFVWNAYFTEQILSEINEIGTDGLSLTGVDDLPAGFLPLEYKYYTITASLIGPPEINAQFLFSFIGETPILRVYGFRTVLFPFRPNWKSNLTERLEWLTDVIESYSGIEQRRGLRKYPRRTIEYELLALGLQDQYLRALLWSWQTRALAIPIWFDSAKITVDVNAGDQIIFLDRIPSELRIDKQAVIYFDFSIYQIVTISDIDSDNVTLLSPSAASFDKGCHLYPVNGGRFVDQKKTTRHTPVLESVVVRFLLEENGSAEPVDSTETYRSIPVLETRPNWGRDVSDDYQHKMEVIDFMIGEPLFDKESDVATVYQQMGWLKSNRVSIQQLRAWLYARKGQLRPVWLPTWAHDLTLALPFNAADTEIYIKGTGYSKFYGDIGRRDIRIELKYGGIFYRRVSSPQPQTDGTEKISIDSEIGQDVSLEDVKIISFLTLSRLNSDAIEIAYQTPEIAEAVITLKSLQDDV